MTSRVAAWEEYNYPLAIGDEVCHRLAEDIRKKLWLILIGRYANTGNTSEPATVEGTDGKTYRCILTHKSAAANKPITGGSWSTYWVLYQTAGGLGETWVEDIDYSVGWVGQNGFFRVSGGAFADFGTGGLNTEDRRGPGFVGTWFDEKWGPYSIVGATQNYGGGGKSEIWFENENIGGGNETVNGNLTNKCPLEITGVNADTAELNGFWRIKNTRQIEIDGTTYVLAQLQDFHVEENLVLLNDRGYPSAGYTKGGSAACNFGGDWYMFCPRFSRDGNIDFTSDAEMIHHYANNARGDNEKRPPDGGRFSWDNNAWWTRTVNPNRYHHYDHNAHRWIGFAQRRGNPLVDYFTVFESWHMLPINTDPKERVAPHWYKETGRMDWQIAGNKVEIQKEQLTNWNTMLAVQGSQSRLRTDPSNLVRTSDITDRTITWGPDETFVTGIYPPIEDDGLNNQREVWKERKYDSRCIWSWIEMAARAGQFVAQVNDVYKTNWLEENRKENDAISISGDPAGTTYEDKWYNGSWNLNGFRPIYNSNQLEWDYLYSKFWGENGSAIEKALSDLGDYDWWYDTDKIYVPYNIKHRWGDIYYEESNNHESPGQVGSAAAEWEVPTPHGNWRKIPKWTLGYVDGGDATDPGVTGFMRDKEKGTPAGVEIVDFIDVVHGADLASDPLQGTEWYNFHSLYSKQAPVNGEYGNYNTNLKDRHGPVHIHDSVSYYERAYLILKLMRDVLNQLAFADIDGDISTTFIEEKSDNEAWMSYTDSDLETLYARIKTWHSTNFNITPSTWDQTAITLLLYGDWDFIRHRDDEFSEWGNWQTQGGSPFPNFGEKQGALKVTSGQILTGSRIAYIRIGFAKYGISVGFIPPVPTLAKIIIKDNVIVEQDPASGYDKFVWIKTLIEAGTTIYFHLYLQNPTDTLYVNNPGPTNQSAWVKVEAPISFPFVSPSFVIEIDWSGWPNGVWERDDTYAKKQLLDPGEDDEPPVYEPIEIFGPPTVYDTNRPEWDLDGVCYTWDDYVAKFHIEIESILMEDLEGNGVEYNFEGTGGSGAKKAEDFDSGYQTSKEYDFILDMAVGGNAGDIDDLVQAISNELRNWLYRVTAKDNASAAGAGQTDNETEPSEYEEMVAKEGTVCPPIGLWHTSPDIDGADIKGAFEIAFGPVDDREVEYRFKTVSESWNSGWQDGSGMRHVGGTAGLPQTYIGMIRTKTGLITSQWSVGILVR